MTKEKRRFRSTDWFGRKDKDGFIHRSWMKNQGLPDDVFDGRPVIGICNTWSELNPCNAHLRDLAEHVKRGVWEAGGLPLEFPVTSTGRSSHAAHRHALPQPGQHGRGGDRSAPTRSMAWCFCAAATRPPHRSHGRGQLRYTSLVVSGGPMLNGKYHGQDIGSGTDVWRFSEEVKAGTHEPGAVLRGRIVHGALSRPLHDHGHRLLHGDQWLKLSAWRCPYNAAIPAVDSRRSVLAQV